MWSPSTLRVALEGALSGHFGRDCPIARLEWRPSPYSTSSPAEEVDAQLGDGQILRLFMKDVSRRALSPDARRAKPAFLYDPMREIEIYRTFLGPAGLGTPTFYGALVD